MHAMIVGGVAWSGAATLRRLGGVVRDRAQVWMAEGQRDRDMAAVMVDRYRSLYGTG